MAIFNIGGIMETYKVVVDDSGRKEWYNQSGQPHRLDGPAVEWASGRKEWWVNGKRHRDDGPAIEFKDGRKEWWFNDRRHTEEEYQRMVSPPIKVTVAEIEKLLGYKIEIISE